MVLLSTAIGARYDQRTAMSTLVYIPFKCEPRVRDLLDLWADIHRREHGRPNRSAVIRHLIEVAACHPDLFFPPNGAA